MGEIHWPELFICRKMLARKATASTPTSLCPDYRIMGTIYLEWSSQHSVGSRHSHHSCGWTQQINLQSPETLSISTCKSTTLVYLLLKHCYLSGLVVLLALHGECLYQRHIGRNNAKRFNQTICDEFLLQILSYYI